MFSDWGPGPRRWSGAMKRLILGAMVAAAVLFSAPKAEAAIIIDFGGVGVQGGTITNLGSGQWSGSGIIVNVLTAINTPLNAGAYATVGTASGFASLDFNTLL